MAALCSSVSERMERNELERKSETRQGQGMTVECEKSCEGTEVEQID